MNQSAIIILSQYQRLYRKMHDTILFARIIPTIILSFACILLLFLALLFGLNLPLLLQYLVHSCLISMCALTSCFFFWEKVVTRPSDNPQKNLLYCLLSETLLPVAAFILASIFLYWPLIFLALFPLAFGLSLWLGYAERKVRLALVCLQGFLLCLSLILTIVYLHQTIGHLMSDIGYVIALLLCLALYFIYNLRQMVLLCDDSFFTPVPTGETATEVMADGNGLDELAEAEALETVTEEIPEDIPMEGWDVDPIEDWEELPEIIPEESLDEFLDEESKTSSEEDEDLETPPEEQPDAIPDDDENQEEPYTDTPAGEEETT